MLHYHNHRFHRKNFSFQIPDGFFLDTEPEVEADNYLRLWLPDQKNSLTVDFAENCADTKSELEGVIADMEPRWSSPVEAVTVNGLGGHYAEYHLTHSRYYELWLNLAEGAAVNIVIRTPDELSGADLSAVLAALDPKMEQEG